MGTGGKGAKDGPRGVVYKNEYAYPNLGANTRTGD